MELWTTFSPRKVCWELAYVRTKGHPHSNWLKEQSLIKDSLKTLSNAEIVGIRLVILAEEITKDGTTFDFNPIESMLGWCEENKLKVDFCLGPLQYPYFPAFRLPPKLRGIVKIDGDLDHYLQVREFGLRFITEQLKKFGEDKRISGFYIGNEWPDKNPLEGSMDVRVGVSSEYMIDLVRLAKSLTKKPILFNTNIDPFFIGRIADLFSPFLSVLGEQAGLGLDVYPTQETWKNAPHIKSSRLVSSYKDALKKLQRTFGPSHILFAEVEAQPWGNGQAWYKLILQSANPQESLHGFGEHDMQKTFEKYIEGTGVEKISLWGADFWLSAKEMNITWPLEMVKRQAR